MEPTYYELSFLFPGVIQAAHVDIQVTEKSALLEGKIAIESKKEKLIADSRHILDDDQRRKFQDQIRAASRRIEQLLSNMETWGSCAPEIRNAVNQCLQDLDSIGQQFSRNTAQNQNKQKSIVEALRTIGGQIQGSNVRGFEEHYRESSSKKPLKCLQKRIKEDPFLALNLPDRGLLDREVRLVRVGREKEKEEDEEKGRVPPPSQHVTIPKGMSQLEAFQALYAHAEVLGLGALNPAAGEAPCSDVNAAQIFEKYCPKNRCDYVRGKCVKVQFGSSEIDARQFDKEYGSGAAKNALETYKHIRVLTKEEYPLNGDPCKYFTPEMKEQTPQEHREDLDDMFERCEPHIQVQLPDKQSLKQIFFEMLQKPTF